MLYVMERLLEMEVTQFVERVEVQADWNAGDPQPPFPSEVDAVDQPGRQESVIDLRTDQPLNRHQWT